MRVTMANMLHFVLRRSTEDQQHSLDVQRAGCTAFVTAKGFKGKVVEHVSDGVAGDDIEGLVAVRRLFEQLKPGDVVVCRDQDRIGRKMSFNMMVIETIAEKGARLFYYSTGAEIFARNAMDGMMNAVSGFGAANELEKIRARTREAIRARVKAGKVGGGACYGYDLVKLSEEVPTSAEVNETQAEVIRRIFAEYIGGAGYKAIAIKLNNERIPSPMAKKRGTGSWSPGQVRDIVRRERYVGVYVHGVLNRVKKGGKRVAVKAAASEVMRVEIPKWRIVDDITWRRAQEIIGDRAPTHKSENPTKNQLSGGIFRCGECGGPIGVVNTKVTGGVRVKAYGCVWHHTRGGSVCSATTRRPAETVEAALADAYQKAVDDPALVNLIMALVTAEVEAEAVEAASVDTSGLAAELVDVKRKHKNLVRVLATIDEEDAGLIAELKALAHRAKEIEKSLAVAARAPVEAAAYIAQANHAVRARLADMRRALANDPVSTRALYRETLQGMKCTPEKGEGRPRRWNVEGALTLEVKRIVTPPGIEPGRAPNDVADFHNFSRT